MSLMQLWIFEEEKKSWRSISASSFLSTKQKPFAVALRDMWASLSVRGWVLPRGRDSDLCERIRTEYQSGTGVRSGKYNYSERSSWHAHKYARTDIKSENWLISVKRVVIIFGINYCKVLRLSLVEKVNKWLVYLFD